MDEGICSRACRTVRIGWTWNWPGSTSRVATMCGFATACPPVPTQCLRLRQPADDRLAAGADDWALETICRARL